MLWSVTNVTLSPSGTTEQSRRLHTNAVTTSVVTAVATAAGLVPVANSTMTNETVDDVSSVVGTVATTTSRRIFKKKTDTDQSIDEWVNQHLFVDVKMFSDVEMLKPEEEVAQQFIEKFREENWVGDQGKHFWMTHRNRVVRAVNQRRSNTNRALQVAFLGECFYFMSYYI